MKFGKLYIKKLLCLTVTISFLFTTNIVNATDLSSKKFEKSAKEAGVNVNVVPAGWNPLVASNEELEFYGFPKRPSDATQEKEWEKVVKDVKWFEPRFTEGSRRATVNPQIGNSSKTNSASKNSYNWGGVQTNNYSERVTGYWQMPWASADTNHRPAYSSSWIGIGGSNGTSKLIQAGTESSILTGGAGQYAVWWEILGTSINNAQQNISNFPFSPGDQFYADISVRPDYPTAGTARASFYILDTTNSSVTSFYKDITNYSGVTNCAEWITERPQESGSIAANFTNVGDVHMWECGNSSTYNGSVTLITDSSQYVWYNNIVSQDGQRYLGIPGTIGSTGNFIFSWANYN